VEVAAPMATTISRHKLATGPKRKTTELEQETDAARQRVVQLQREMLLQRSERARAEFYQRKQDEAEEQRQRKNDMLGVSRVAKVKLMEEDEVCAISSRLHEQLMAEHQTSTQMGTLERRSFERQVWLGLWREMDVDGFGRIDFDQLSAMLRRKLRLRGRTQAQKDKISMKLQSLWRALDDDGEGNARGVLSKEQLVAFMKLSRKLSQTDVHGESGDGPSTEGRHGWRERLAAQRQREAASLRKQRREGQTRHGAQTDLESWREKMSDVVPASATQQKELSAALNSSLGDLSWYSLFKLMDRDGDGRISFEAWAAMLHERCATLDGQVHELRSKPMRQGRRNSHSPNCKYQSTA
jgi:Ca2+-binding EF-hand superfamily protein